MTRLFLSYSHADEEYCDMLQKHLSALQHQGLIEPWHDRRIRAGDEFENVIDKQLNEADIILLLVSSDFIASRYCYEIEMKRALKRHHAGEARVVPVILRPCDWSDTPFGKLLAAPKNGKAVKLWPDIDEAFLDVVRYIKAALPRDNPPPSATDVAPAATLTSAPIVEGPRSAKLTIRKSFTEADKDEFLDRTYTYIAVYFENSLQELQARNPDLTTRFRKIDETRFTAVVYRNGTAVSRCKITLGGMFGRSIGFSFNDQPSDNSLNENLSVDADEQHLYLKAMGMAAYGATGDRNLTQEGAAELYWSLLMQVLQ